MLELVMNEANLQSGSFPVVDRSNNPLGKIVFSAQGSTIQIFDTKDQLRYSSSMVPKKLRQIMELSDSGGQALGTVMRKMSFLKWKYEYAKTDGSSYEIKEKSVTGSKLEISNAKSGTVLVAEKQKGVFTLKLDESKMPVLEAVALFKSALLIKERELASTSTDSPGLS